MIPVGLKRQRLSSPADNANAKATLGSPGYCRPHFALTLIAFAALSFDLKAQQQVPDVCWTGTWVGTYSYVDTQSNCVWTNAGNLTWTLSSVNGVITGSASEDGIACIDFTNCNIFGRGTASGSISGSVSGTTITLSGNLLDSCNNQSYTNDFVGTMNGCTITGSTTNAMSSSLTLHKQNACDSCMLELYFDSNTSGAGWATDDAHWSTNSSGGSDIDWINGYYANFGTAKKLGNVTVPIGSAGVDVAQITVVTGGIKFTPYNGDSTAIITLDNFNSTGYCLVSVYNGGATYADFATVLAGSGVGLEVGGDGTAGIILSAANTYSGGTKVDSGGEVTVASSSSIPSGALILGSSTGGNAIIKSTPTDGQVSSNITVSIGNAVTIGGNVNFCNGEGGNLLFTGGVTLGANATLEVNLLTVTFDCVVSGGYPITLGGSEPNPGTMILSGANTYTGATTINTGTLALGSSGSINNSATISIAAGATFDVSAIASYALSSSTTFSAAGTGTTTGSTAATIKGGTTISLGSQPINLTYKPTAFNGDTNHPALYISQGTLSLNGNVFTVNNASGTPLGAGTYSLIQQAGGSTTSSGSYRVSVTGSGLASGDTAFIQVSGGNVNLVVGVLPVIQTAKQSGSSFTFTWSAISNQMYQIQSTANLSPANWTNLGSALTASNSIATNIQTIGINRQQFYRVVLEP